MQIFTSTPVLTMWTIHQKHGRYIEDERLNCNYCDLRTQSLQFIVFDCITAKFEKPL